MPTGNCSGITIAATTTGSLRGLVANSLFIRNAAGDPLGGAACLYGVDEIILFHGNTVADNTRFPAPMRQAASTSDRKSTR